MDLTQKSAIIFIAIILGSSFGSSLGLYYIGLVISERDGYDSIVDEGYGMGVGDGFENGTDDGYQSGYNDSYPIGYDDGWENAFNQDTENATGMLISPEIDGSIEEDEWKDANYYMKPYWFNTETYDGENYISVGRDNDYLYIAIDLCSARQAYVENEMISIAMLTDIKKNFTTQAQFESKLNFGTEICTAFNNGNSDEFYVSHASIYDTNTIENSNTLITFGFGSSPNCDENHRMIECRFPDTKIYGCDFNKGVYLYIHGNSVKFDLNWNNYDILQGYWFGLGNGNLFDWNNYDLYTLAV